MTKYWRGHYVSCPQNNLLGDMSMSPLSPLVSAPMHRWTVEVKMLHMSMIMITLYLFYGQSIKSVRLSESMMKSNLYPRRSWLASVPCCRKSYACSLAVLVGTRHHCMYATVFILEIYSVLLTTTARPVAKWEGGSKVKPPERFSGEGTGDL